MVSANRLVAELNRLGVHFLTGGEQAGAVAPLTPAELLTSLPVQSEARLRLAIIPLLLVHPELAAVVPEALTRLSSRAQVTLKLFYTAAVLLQQIHDIPLHELLGNYKPLPDRFAEELGIAVTDDPITRLKQLGKQHQILTGLKINWVGTYHHAAERLLKQLNLEVRWSS